VDASQRAGLTEPVRPSPLPFGVPQKQEVGRNFSGNERPPGADSYPRDPPQVPAALDFSEGGWFDKGRRVPRARGSMRFDP